MADKKAIIAQACDAGETFAKLYYETFDTKRPMVHQLVASHYAPDAVLVWNGNPLNGAEPIANFFGGLPPTKHTIEVLDVQPCPLLGHPMPLPLLVTVKGLVKYGKSPSKSFSQTFMLKPPAPGAGTYVVANDCFRCA
eukprot:m.54929 g.54929  ORF g.54929 m.54929 type:complete len:138 (+) comp12493_c0_seq2:305-718(+)